jgi:long-chain acyl-CoA synthetase
VLEYYHGLGVGLNALYGLTDGGMPTMTRPGLSDLGTVGVVVPGYELRLAADGEILVRSDNAPTGYHNQPEETAATYTADGWIRTGDIGTLDDHGRLGIIDRKKELVIPDHGHNVPAPKSNPSSNPHAPRSPTCASSATAGRTSPR